MGKLHYKTELCDGHCHMTAHEYREHKYREKQYKQRRALAKLANNPILNEEAKHTIAMAIFDSDMMEYWREAYIQLKEKYEKEQRK